MIIKPAILLLSALVGLSTYSMVSRASDLLDDTTSQVTGIAETITDKSDLVIVTFHDDSYIEMLTAYYASQTQGEYISDELYSQAQTLLQTLSDSYGAELTITRIARLGAVVLKLSELVELDELDSHLDTTLNTLKIIDYAEPDPYLSVNILKQSKDDADIIVIGAEVDHDATVEPGQEGSLSPQLEPWGYQRIQAEQLSDATADNMTVCIIDTGYDISHEDLPHDMVAGAALSSLDDENGHGTHATGIIAALDNQYGSKGILPNGKLNLIIKRVSDENNSLSSTSFSIIADTAYDCAEEGANIISMSLEESAKIPARYSEDVFQAVHNKNVLMIAARGNDGDEQEAYPAAFSSVIATGSLNSDNQITDFTNQSSTAELMAPANGIYSTVPVGLEERKSYSAEIRINGETYTNSYFPLEADSVIDEYTTTESFVTYCELGQCLWDYANVEDSICIAVGNNDYCNYYTDSNGEILVNNRGNWIKLNPLHVLDLDTISDEHVNELFDSLIYDQTVTFERVLTGVDGYSYSNDPSIATSYVTGAAALAWSNNAECTAAEVRTALSESAKDLGADGWDELYGHGLVQAKDASDYMRTHCAAYIDAEPVTYKNLSLIADNDKYVISEKADSYTLGDVRAVRTILNNWDRLKMVDLNGGLLVNGDEVYFINAYGNYISRSDTDIYAHSSDVAEAETFTIETSTTDAQTIGNGSSIYIKASNGLYWQTDNSGYLNADANVVEGTERSCLDSECQSSVFELIMLPQVTYFKTTKGKRVEMLNTVGNDIQANKYSAGSLKEFSIIDLNEGSLMSGDRIRLQSQYLGTYVSRDGTELYGSSFDVEDSETFIIENIARDNKELVTSDLITIKASNDLYWQSKISGAVDADGSSIEGSEKSCTTSETDCGWTVFELEIKEL